MKTTTFKLRRISVASATVDTALMNFPLSVCIEAIFPLFNLQHLFIAILIFFISIWPRRVIDIIPVLHGRRLFVLLTLLFSATLPLLGGVTVM